MDTSSRPGTGANRPAGTHSCPQGGGVGYESRKWAIWRDSTQSIRNRAPFRFYDTTTDGKTLRIPPTACGGSILPHNWPRTKRGGSPASPRWPCTRT